MDKDTLWQSTLAQLQLTISKSIFSVWFKTTTIKSITKVGDRQIVEITVANSYARQTIEQNYLGQIRQALNNISQTNNEVIFVVSSAPKKEAETVSGPLFSFDADKEKQGQISSSLARAHINPEYTFQNFAVASTNEMAYAAATQVAKNPGKSYNPLFLYGGVGVGKTHLMQAIGIEVLGKNPEASILYCSGEEFMNEIIEAIRGKQTPLFRRKYRNLKLLFIDDIQFIAGKDTVQEEFFHTFNAIKQLGGQIVLTSDRLPEQIEGLEDRLRSRFEGGLTIDIQEPNFELRTAILLIKAKQMGENLPIEAAKAISQSVTSTRKLEGALVRVLSEKHLTKQELTVDLVRQVLLKISGMPVDIKTRTTPDRIIKTVADFYQLKLNEIKGTRRVKQIVFPRQMAIYILRSELNLPHQEIGRLFGGKDHTTIMHSVEKITLLVNTSAKIQEELALIRKKIV